VLKLGLDRQLVCQCASRYCWISSIIPAKFHCGPVMAFVHVLVNIFDSPDIESELQIDMTLKLQNEHGTERNHIPIIHTMVSDNMLPTIIGTIVMWVAFFIYRGFLTKFLGKVFRALPILHARGIRMLRSTGPMGHQLTDQFVKCGMCLLIGKDG
jgi:hypothetical protein